MTPIEKVAAKLDTFSRDCAVTVALKITDDSCKMDEEQRSIFMALYDAIESSKSELFDESVYTLIHTTRNFPSATLFAQIKNEREMAMAIITQEKMKAFKASVRAALLIEQLKQ
jgi:hypothetical protein